MDVCFLSLEFVRMSACVVEESKHGRSSAGESGVGGWNT